MLSLNQICQNYNLKKLEWKCKFMLRRKYNKTKVKEKESKERRCKVQMKVEAIKESARYRLYVSK